MGSTVFDSPEMFPISCFSQEKKFQFEMNFFFFLIIFQFSHQTEKPVIHSVLFESPAWPNNGQGQGKMEGWANWP